MDWGLTMYFASERAARQCGARAKRKGEQFTIDLIEFRPTKANILKMLNREGYADVCEEIADYTPPVP